MSSVDGSAVGPALDGRVAAADRSGTHHGSIEGRAQVARKRICRAGGLATGVRDIGPHPALTGQNLSGLLRGQFRAARGWSAGRSPRPGVASYGIHNAH